MMFFFSSRRRHTRCGRDWSSDVCSSDLCDNKTIPASRRPRSCAPDHHCQPSNPDNTNSNITTPVSAHVCKCLCNLDRKSTRLNSSHVRISYAVFCLKKKKHYNTHPLSNR